MHATMSQGVRDSQTVDFLKLMDLRIFVFLVMLLGLGFTNS